MKILIVTQGYYPGQKYGGPPVSIKNFCDLMVQSIEVFIITLNHDLGDSQVYQSIAQGWNILGNCSVMYLQDKCFNRNTFEREICMLKPDVIYLQSLFQQCVLPVTMIAKKMNLKLLLAPRGELCSGAMKKKYKKLPYIFLLRMLGLTRKIAFQSTSPEETNDIVKYFGVQSNVYYLENIPSKPRTEYNQRFKESGVARIIFISRIVEKKNLLYALICLQSVTEGDVVFDVFGSIEDEGYWEKCLKASDKLSPNIKFTYRGELAHDDVQNVMSNYDVFILPTYSENYGHVIAEALSVSVPVIISNTTPWNCVNEERAGWAIPLDNRNGFVDAINNIISMNNSQYVILSRNAKTLFENSSRYEKLKEKYLFALKQIVKN
ncbi:glycosyltransferase [Sphaerochaeta halotolerans]|uniref:Glycosyltransferase n=1 Tax=Sphaerochaeta halotolerans TaxID=2293840 RepID=A0A372MEK5_9SPIR|nr:glycosyltransferase [Sphaerochaeta halotolerans]RFU93818.1 glycosyltransferase [Sphaerochaeta halotolerans]